MFKIGNIEIENNIILAPMAGYTSEGFRDFMCQFPIGMCYTEMVSDMGLIYGNKETIDYLPKKKCPVPIAMQLFGSKPENIKKAAQIALEKCPYIDIIDINMGCPVSKVVKTGAGSTLLKNADLAAEIVKAVKSITNIPITAKIRLGSDDKHVNFEEVIEKLTLAGVSAIALHARTTKQLYSGKPNYELIRDLRSKMKVPLIISGDIFSAKDAKSALEITGADGVMVARGIIGHPNLVYEIDTLLKTGEEREKPSFLEQKNLCLQLAQYIVSEKGEARGMRVYRSMASKFFFGLPNVKELNVKLSGALVSYKQLEQILNEYETTLLYD